MPFDGGGWAEGALIPAIAYQPEAGNLADLWLNALLTSFAKARSYGRLVTTHGFAWNGLLAQRAVTATSRIVQVDYQSLGEFDCFVEATWTHLHAAVAFMCAASETAYAY